MVSIKKMLKEETPVGTLITNLIRKKKFIVK